MNTQLENRVNTYLKEHNCPSVVIKGYGLTEVSSAVCGSRADINTVGSVGIPFIRNSIAIFEPGTQNELGYNQNGEICITGPTTMLGYYKHEAETAAVKQMHKDGRIWIHSGDMGYMNEDGLLFVIDRIKRLIIRSGWNIYPTQIENVIAQHYSVLTCTVIGIPDAEHGSIPKAYIVLKQDTNKPKDQILREIKALCRHQLVEYAVPEHYCFRDSLPLTPVGKVDFVALQNESI